MYFIGGDSGASNSIIRMASTSPYTATTLATSSGTGSLNDLFRGLTLSPTLPVVAPPIVALRLTNGGAALSATNGNAIVIDQYNGTALVSSTPVPPTQCSLDGAAVNTYVYEGRLSQSSDALSVSLGCFATAVGTPVSGAARAIVSINASNFVSAPLSTLLAGPALMAVTQAAAGAYYFGAAGTPLGLFYVSPAGVTTTLSSSLDIVAISIYSGSLWVASPKIGYGVYLVGTSGTLPVSTGVGFTQVTGGYTGNQWTSSFVFQSPTALWTTDEGYNVGACRTTVPSPHLAFVQGPGLRAMQLAFTASRRLRFATRLHVTRRLLQAGRLLSRGLLPA